MNARSAAALFGRLAVGAVLVYAGAGKAAAPAEEFAVVIEAYGLIPPSQALAVAGLLPWAELLIGWALLLGVRARGAALAAGGLFAAFLLALGSTLARGVPLPNCGCFGDAVHFTLPQALAFDALMLLLCVAAFRCGPGGWSLDSWKERGL